ncbi:MAG: class I SAM-dependent methyltransferase [Synergistaceae bacterium]|jgi:hypothetical protein|nr:class I SAM-dependent methyltransferase [Synergistaceae bacterium]
MEGYKIHNTLEECKKTWGSIGVAERVELNTRWIRYYQYIAKQCQDGADGESGFNPHAEEAVSYLAKGGWLKDVASVIDIGAGTGSYSLSFAKQGCAVTALDMDGVSLSVLERRAEQLGLKSIHCVEDMWENYRSGKKFSLAFSAMCPAICNYDELLKMEAMTACACCLIAVTRGSRDIHRENLTRLLGAKPRGMTTEALTYYETLYLMGRQPDVKNWTAHYKYSLPVDEACRRNEVYFEIFGIPAEQSRPVLKAYFERKADNGLVHDESHLNTALICWRPYNPA